MQRVLIFSYSPHDWDGYLRILRPILENSGVELVTGALSCMTEPPYPLDLILTSSHELPPYIQSFLPKPVPALWIQHTIEKQMLARLLEMAEKGRISVVSDTLCFSEGRRKMLMDLGIPRECLTVWAPHLDPAELESQAIVFEGAALPSEYQGDFIQVDARGLISVDTIVQTALALNQLNLLQSNAFQRYRERVCPTAYPFEESVDIQKYYAHIHGKSVRNGILFFTEDMTIYYCDDNAALLLGRRPKALIRHVLPEVFPFLRSYEDDIDRFGEQVIRFGDRHLAFQIWRTYTHNSYNGYILVTDYAAAESKVMTLKRRPAGSSHIAKYTFASIIGKSPAIQKTKELAKRMARSQANILITGPTGSGKELFAQAIHNASERKKFPFVSVNCGALVDTLLESELFGYEAGAFTGARKEGKKGLFELAHRGTLFLDELGEISIPLQVKLLRVLQEKEVVPIGGSSVIPIDVRIIAATNRNLAAMVREQVFRMDLYYRLNVLPLPIPSLREREEDILPLFYILCQKYGFQFRIDEEVKGLLLGHDYAGNIRELENCVEYLGNLGKMQITAADLPPYFSQPFLVNAPIPPVETLSPPPSTPLEQVLWAIRELSREGASTGRRSIYAFLHNHSIPLSEPKLRQALDRLSSQGIIEIHSGRSGVRLTEK